MVSLKVIASCDTDPCAMMEGTSVTASVPTLPAEASVLCVIDGVPVSLGVFMFVNCIEQFVFAGRSACAAVRDTTKFPPEEEVEAVQFVPPQGDAVTGEGVDVENPGSVNSIFSATAIA